MATSFPNQSLQTNNGRVFAHPALQTQADYWKSTVTPQVTGLLQTTLDWQQVLTLFTQSVRKYVNAPVVSYSHPLQGLDWRSGKPETHNCQYRLVLMDEDLGELNFSRSHRFSDLEIEHLENLLCALLYPLRNALQYLTAMRLATTDALTGLGNRCAFNDELQRATEFAKRHDIPLTMMVIDLDHFKQVNDTYGHTAGDRVLNALAALLKDASRGSDRLFRYGGEEFVIMMPKTDTQGAHNLAERIQQDLSQLSLKWQEDSIQVTASIGITSLHTGDDALGLFERADQALYQAKNNGRNQICMFP